MLTDQFNQVDQAPLHKGRYKLYVKFNSRSTAKGVTLYSYDNPYNPEFGYQKLLQFVQKAKRNGQLLVAIIYDTHQDGREVYRIYGEKVSGA